MNIFEHEQGAYVQCHEVFPAINNAPAHDDVCQRAQVGLDSINRRIDYKESEKQRRHF